MLEDKSTQSSNRNSEDTVDNSITKRFQARSEAAQEIISHQPGFLEKWALLLFLCILFILIGGTWFIRYPDIIEAHGKLTSDNAPKEIIPLQSGRLIKLFVKNGTQIKKGEMIAWLESTANTGELLSLSAKLDSSLLFLSEGKSENVSALFQNKYQNLGEIQGLYQTFNTTLQQYNDYLVNGFYVRKKATLLSDMTTLQQMNDAIEKQKILMKQDEDSSHKTLAMNKILLDQKVISQEEYRQERSKYLNKQMAIPQINQTILSNQNQQRNKLQDLDQLNHDILQQKLIFEQALQTLKSNIEDWKRKYIIQSPIDGTVFFTLPLQTNKFIEQGKLLGYINPPDSKFYAEVSLPQNNLGKIDTGMQVQLRFDAYPYQELGFVKGKLDYISSVASDSGFLATVRLQNGLETNMHKYIQYKNGLRAQALIITKDMRLLERMYYSVVKSISPGK